MIEVLLGLVIVAVIVLSAYFVINSNPKCDTVCFNGGVVSPQSCKCVCPPGYSGVNCEINTVPVIKNPPDQEPDTDPIVINPIPSNSSNPTNPTNPTNPKVCSGKCLNGGIMDDNCICICPNSWTGSDCSRRVCSGKCLNGTMDNNCRCQCSQGWLGSDCSIRDCSATVCINGTVDADCTCNCVPGYEGADCSSKICTNQCIYGTLQSDCQCICDSTHKGLACDQKICDPTMCGSHGVPDANCNCQCGLGWKGTKCDIRECSQTICKNGGVPDANCQCICPPNYSGSDCSVYTAPILPPPPPPPPVITDRSIISIRIEIGAMGQAFKYDSITFTANGGQIINPGDSTYGYTTTIKPYQTGYWIVDFKFKSPINLEKVKIVNNRDLFSGMFGCLMTMVNKTGIPNNDTCWLTYQKIMEFTFNDGLFVKRTITNWTTAELGGTVLSDQSTNMVGLISISGSEFNFDSITFIDTSGNILVKDDPIFGYDFVVITSGSYGYNGVQFKFRTPFRIGQIIVNNNLGLAFNMSGATISLANQWGGYYNVSAVRLSSDKKMVITYEDAYPVNMTSIAWPTIISSETAPSPVSANPGTKVGYVVFQTPSESSFSLAEVLLYAGNRDLKKKDVIITENNQYYNGNYPASAVFDKSLTYIGRNDIQQQYVYHSESGYGKYLQIRLLTPTVIDVIQIIGEANSWKSSNATMSLRDVNNNLIVNIPLKNEFSQTYTMKNDVLEYVGVGQLPPLIT